LSAQENAALVVGMLNELRLPFAVEASEIASPCGRDMLFLLLFLYQYLPQLMPCATIDFSGRLSEAQTRRQADPAAADLNEVNVLNVVTPPCHLLF
jgi:hypothetical protein